MLTGNSPRLIGQDLHQFWNLDTGRLMITLPRNIITYYNMMYLATTIILFASFFTPFGLFSRELSHQKQRLVNDTQKLKEFQEANRARRIAHRVLSRVNLERFVNYEEPKVEKGSLLKLVDEYPVLKKAAEFGDCLRSKFDPKRIKAILRESLVITPRQKTFAGVSLAIAVCVALVVSTYTWSTCRVTETRGNESVSGVQDVENVQDKTVKECSQSDEDDKEGEMENENDESEDKTESDSDESEDSETKEDVNEKNRKEENPEKRRLREALRNRLVDLKLRRNNQSEKQMNDQLQHIKNLRKGKRNQSDFNLPQPWAGR
ncbi:hypothetical protein SK128_003555 [Halocaridina rubra]|uniref:Uncharacterized protein n=1 Tax=Halocaridina rubra TaxID=373956 RepID=A0AAN9A8X7_HALRR